MEFYEKFNHGHGHDHRRGKLGLRLRQHASPRHTLIF